jgi:hypothetical protein
MNAIEDCGRQLGAVEQFFEQLAAQQDRMPIAVTTPTDDIEDEEGVACRAA